ncbi:MAG: DMT family transporter [Treponemataceae bacterium]
MDSKVKALLARIALFVTAIFWGSSLTVASLIKDFTPNFLLALRFSIACLLLAVIFFPRLKKINKEYLLSGFLIGFFLFIAYSSQFFGVMVAEGAPGRSGFISASYCVIVPFLAWIFLKERPDKYNILAAIFCLIGLFFVFYTELAKDVTTGFSAGDLYALISGVLFAVHIVAVAKWGKGKDPVVITILQFFFAAIFSTVVAFVFEKPSFEGVSRNAFLALAYLAIMCTAVALLFQTIGQRYTPSSTAALILGTEAVFSIIFAVVFAGEELNLASVIGFVFIFLAIIISETKLEFLKKSKGQKSTF